MKALVASVAVTGLLGVALFGQQFKFNLDHLAKKASNTVDLSLGPDLIQFGAAMLDGKDADQAKVKKIVGSLQGIYVKSFEFKRDGEYSKADLDQIRLQLKGPEWQRAVGINSDEERETVEVWIRNENGKISGIAILVAEPRELTVVNLVGSVELSALSELGGAFGIPKFRKKK